MQDSDRELVRVHAIAREAFAAQTIDKGIQLNGRPGLEDCEKTKHDSELNEWEFAQPYHPLSLASRAGWKSVKIESLAGDGTIDVNSLADKGTIVVNSISMARLSP